MNLVQMFTPTFGVAIGNGAQALSEDQLLQRQVGQQRAMMQAHPNTYANLRGLSQYQPPQRPLDERFADFKVRLAAAFERHREARR